MKKSNKILSALLAVVMLLGSFTVAASATIDTYDEEGKLITGNKEVDYNITLNKYLGYDKDGKPVTSTTLPYETPQEKLASMELMWEKYGYQLWADSITGEVATVKMSTGEILFSNPWNVGTTKADGSRVALDIKKQLLSQIIVNYVDNDQEATMNSCTEAASRGQINIEYIKNGIRVEYSIGREQTRMLVPKRINAERFEEKILKVMREALNKEEYITVSDGTVVDPDTGKAIRSNLDDWPGAEAYIGQTFPVYDLIKICYPDFDMSGPADLDIDRYLLNRLASFYSLKDPEDPKLTDRTRQEMEIAYPITKKMAVYVIDPATTQREFAIIENYIKTYVVSYTYEELDYDHELTEYNAVEKAPPLFKMALEYTVDQTGLSVRLPANGIRYDESLYRIKNVEMLPFMGAGSNKGYTFFPDGSGALFDFEELSTGNSKSKVGKVYGQDYAYHSISGTYQETIRYPAFGVVENYTGKKTVTDYDKIVTPAEYDEDGTLITPTKYGTKNIDVKENKGFLAIVEEGEALAELQTTHDCQSHGFHTVKMIYTPRPYDKYNMADAISVGNNTEMTVVSERKYVGSYTVRYIMLTDDTLALENNLSSYYECSWMGMAVAYREYLESINVLTRLTENDVDDDIPLYIETFGTLLTTEKFMSIPMDVMTPLTTFEDINTMYTELSASIENSMKEMANSSNAIAITEESASNFSNINFKLTGYANGGMFSTVPYHLNWESAVGGASGFEALLEQSKKEGFGIFPDFDFAYINTTDFFDGVSLKNHAVKTIDNRYTARREYSATYQTFVGYFQLAIAPSCFERFVTKLATNYLKYNPTGISVSTLGSDLNSDFDEDEPLNREDSKEYTIEALKILANLKNEDGNNLEIMTDGGNSYTWKYMDHIINMPINSSRYLDASNAVPFIGVVLHGYVQFAGTPINQEGDLEMAMLKAIENGASIYFTLAYQNASEFKEDMILNQYFSVRYDIWKEDLVDMYVELNNLLGDLQTKLIIDHDFLTGERIPDEDEIIADEEAKAEAERLEQLLKETEEAKLALKEALETRHTPAESIETVEEIISAAQDHFDRMLTYTEKFDSENVKKCAEIVEEMSELNKTIKQKQELMYKEMVSNDPTVIAAIKENVKVMLEMLLASGADSVINSATAGKDEATAVKNAIISVAVEEASTLALSIAAGDVELNADGFVNSIVETVSVKSEEVKAANATSEHATLIAAVADAILTNATTMSSAVLQTVLDNSQSIYDEAVNAEAKDVTNYINAVKALKASIKNAFAAGAEKTDIEAIISGSTASFDGKNLDDVISKYQAVVSLDVANVAKYSAIYEVATDEFNTTAVEGDHSYELILKVIGADSLVLTDDGILDKAALDILNQIATIDHKEFEYSEYLNELEKNFEILTEYSEKIRAAEEASQKATEKIYETWIDYQQKAAKSAEELIVYKTAYFAAAFSVNELNELYEELLADENAIDADKLACLNAIAISQKTVDEIKAEYNAAADEDKAQLKILLDAANVLVEFEYEAKLIKAELDKIQENKAVYDKKVISYEQFYNTAVAETATVTELKAAFDIKYETAKAQYNSQPVIEAMVLLFGANNFDKNEEEFNTQLEDANRDDPYIEDMLSDIQKYIDIITNEKKTIDELTVKYVKLTKDYEKLLAKDIFSMTEMERAAYLTERINLSREIINTKNILNQSVANIKSSLMAFEVPYALNKGIYDALNDALATMTAEFETVKELVELIPNNSEYKEEMIAVKSDYEARIEALKAASNDYMTLFDELCVKAVEIKILEETENGLIFSEDTSYSDAVNDIFNPTVIAPEKVETTKYTCDDGSIVVVTYGGKDGDDDAPYRSFILNHNAFDVTVEYAGIKYILPAYGYKVINY